MCWPFSPSKWQKSKRATSGWTVLSWTLAVSAPQAQTSPPLVEHDAARAADDPAVGGDAFAAKTREEASALFAVGVGHLDAIAVGDAEDGRLYQEAISPPLVRAEQAKQARARGQRRNCGRSSRSNQR